MSGGKGGVINGAHNAIHLFDIAHGRSGDKGNHANIAIIAYTRAGYDFLEKELTAEKVSAYLRSVHPERVERFALPKLFAFNFLLRNVLGGGASDALRTDTQGKVLATALLEMELPAPPDLHAMLPSSQEGAISVRSKPVGSQKDAASPHARKET